MSSEPNLKSRTGDRTDSIRRRSRPNRDIRDPGTACVRAARARARGARRNRTGSVERSQSSEQSTIRATAECTHASGGRSATCDTIGLMSRKHDLVFLPIIAYSARAQRRDSDRLSATHFDRTNCAEDAATVLSICRTRRIILGFSQATLVEVPIETIRDISR